MWFPPACVAQTSFTVEPDKIDFAVGPGSFTKKTFAVVNNSDELLHLKLYATDIIVAADGTTQYGLLPKKDKTSAARWFSFSRKQLSLKPKEKKKVAYQCKTPNSIRADIYQTMIFVEEQTKAKNEGTIALGVGGRIGILTKVNILEETRAKINSVSVPYIANSKGVTFTVAMTNTGSTLFRPKGKTIIKSRKGEKVATLPFPWVELGYGEKKEIQAVWDDSPWFGCYNANIIVNEGGTQPPQRFKARFFIFPWKIALILLGVLLLISVAWFFFLKPRQKGRET